MKKPPLKKQELNNPTRHKVTSPKAKKLKKASGHGAKKPSTPSSPLSPPPPLSSPRRRGSSNRVKPKDFLDPRLRGEDKSITKTSKSSSVLYRKLKLLGVTFLLLLCIFSMAGAYWFQRPLPNANKIILIHKGASLSKITTLLNQEGLLDFPFLFKGLVYGTKSWNQLKAGEYFIPASVTPAKLLHILKSGNVILHPVTLIPGETSYTFMQRLLVDTRFQGPCELPPEGSILPETYHFPRGTERAQIINYLKKNMREKLLEMWAQRAPGHPLHCVEDLVILASIVEKETALHAEKPIVAAVFLNRLGRNMPLQADPTIVYSLTQGKEILERDLTLKDLQVESPYNTYLHATLPPSPIANPSLSSIHAVLHPDNVPYLYFVADGKGGHVFSTDLTEHHKNQALWRKIKKEK